MEQIIFESSPAYLLICAAMAIALAYLLYKMSHPWTKLWNTLLFVLRSLLLFLLLFLLLGPIVKQINNIFEKPLFVLLYDNSVSVKESTDSVLLNNLKQDLKNTRDALNDQGYETLESDLTHETVTQWNFDASVTDINAALKRIMNQYEGRKIAGVAIASDGIYNAGISPLNTSYNFPVFTVGVGDTLQRKDLAIKNVAYNKIAYQGNTFPIKVEVLTKAFSTEPVRVLLYQKGKVIDQQVKNANADGLLEFNFQSQANEQGIQKFDVQVEVKPGEHNVRNNRASVFVEVVEGKKKILVIASAPHPDIKALREVISKNSNYEFLLHIPGLMELQPSELQPDKIDLAIFHQSPDFHGQTKELFQQYMKSKTTLWIIVGQQTDLRLLAQSGAPIRMESVPREYDDVTPVVNPSFSHFTISPEASSLLTEYPPVSVHFGKISVPVVATPLLFQQIGSLPTQKPLLTVSSEDDRKISILLGEGIWRWRLNEYDRTENTVGFDELFGKLIQYLSTTEDKRKFRSYPIQQEFADTETVVFESQVYNDIFEPVYGNTIELEITGEAGKPRRYSYVTSQGNIRYQVGALKEGIYRYKAQTTLDGKKEEVKGEFAVIVRQNELQNLTADFDLLKQLSANTGGKFYKLSDIESLRSALTQTKAASIIHTEEFYRSVINLKWVFWLLLALVTVEWFSRKFWGSY
ncbi:MAG TPA: VWA domain-containing protein [Ohtaekwangia sp.]